MNVHTLEMTTEQATEALRHYEDQVAQERTVEDQAIMAAYRAAARGLPVISLRETIRAGGFFDAGNNGRAGRPRLAIVRADATAVQVRSDGDDIVYSTFDTWGALGRNRGALVGAETVRVPRVLDTEHRWFHSGTTVVPLIPPQHRPRRNRIRGFHILWEVERWDPTPPVDPALLRHIRGDLWSVVATWDLTPLERAVLAARST